MQRKQSSSRFPFSILLTTVHQLPTRISRSLRKVSRYVGARLACVPGCGEFAGVLSSAHGALQRVAIERGLEFDLHGVAVASLALLGPRNGVARNGGVSSVIAALRLVSDFEFIAVFRDHERLRAAATAAVSAALTTTLTIGLAPALAAAATATGNGHVPGTHKIGTLRGGLECRHGKQQGDEIENCESQPKFFHGAISLMFEPVP